MCRTIGQCLLSACVGVCGFIAAAHAADISGNEERYCREDVPLPPGMVSAIPIGGSEAGDIVGLAWDGAGVASVWLRLADSEFGIPAGWILLSSGAELNLSHFVSFSPNGQFVALSSIPEVGIRQSVLATALGGTCAESRNFEQSEVSFGVRAVSNDGAAIGLARGLGLNGAEEAAWSDITGVLAIAAPSPECMALLPLAATTQRRAVALAKFGADQPPRAVLVTEGRSCFLDELASGNFPWVSSIHHNGTVVAAVMREDGAVHICRLVDTGIDGNGDGAVRFDDLPIFLERYLEASACCDVNLSGETEATDISKWLDVAADSAPSPSSARAWQLVSGVQCDVPFEDWPWQIRSAAERQVGQLLGAELRLPAYGPHTEACRTHVVGLSPACNVMWDAACESLAEIFYAESATVGGAVAFACRDAMCALDPFCCGSWEARCEELATVYCVTLPAGYGCTFTQPWPYNPNAPVATSWAYCGAVGGVSFDLRCFDQCCFEHDVCYSTCGATGAIAGYDSFDACNIRFLTCMQAACARALDDPALGSQCGGFWECQAKATAYWGAVQKLSDDAWCQCCSQVTPERCTPAVASPARGSDHPPNSESEEDRETGWVEWIRRWA